MGITGIGQYAWLDANDVVLQPTPDPKKSFGQFLAEAEGTAGGPRRGQKPPAPGDGILQTADMLGMDLANRKRNLTPELEQFLAMLGVQVPPAVHLIVQPDGAVVAQDHPAKAAIDTAIAAQPEFADRLRQTIGLANLLYANDEGQAYLRATLRDPLEAALRFPEFASGEKVPAPMALTMAIKDDQFDVSFARRY